jgi:hypothetical protein
MGAMPYANRLRACVVCRRTFTAVGAEHRCPDHEPAHRRARNAAARVRRPRDHREEAEHRAILADWRARHGGWCPGLGQHEPHLCPPDRLTVHHLWAVADGGPRVGGPKVVLCMSENSRLGSLGRRT